MPDDITIRVDGKTLKTAPGKMVLEAAIEAGIYIPYLCYHPKMKPFAACRVCVVEVEGGKGFPASCTLPAQDGMVIRTSTQQVYQLRRGIMEMLIAEHPHGCLTCHRIDLCGPRDVCLRHVSVNDRCVICPKNERCELKDTVRSMNMELESPLEYRYRDLPIEVGDPFYDRDYNLCIVCGRCVRVCEEVRGDNALTFVERAGQALVGTSHGTSLLESGCESCGACIDVCPVGALVERDHKWDKASRVVRTICPHCPVGCQLNLEVNRFGKVIRSVPELNGPANQGQACFKGKFGLNFVHHKDRLKQPMIRRGDRLEKASWEEAFEAITNGLSTRRGKDFALLTSPQSTNENLYFAQKFARVAMSTNNINLTSDLQPGLVQGLLETVGHASSTNPIWELEDAGCILTFNSNVTEEHNVIGVPIKRAVNKHTKLVVIDPREVELSRYAHLWLRPKPHTELLLLNGIVKTLVDQALVNDKWVQQRCENLEELKQSLSSFDLDSVAKDTGVPKDQIEEAARLYATNGPAAIVYSLDNIPTEQQRSCVNVLTNITLLTGNLGMPSSGLYPLRHGANVQGAWDMGCTPTLLPGYRHIADSQARQDFQTTWGQPVPNWSGLNLHEVILAAKKKEIKALYLIGDSPYFYDGQLGNVPEILADIEFLIVHDSFLSPIAQQANVVLPLASFAEQEGSYTNVERRIQLLQKVLPSNANEHLSESQIFSQIAQRMGVQGFEHSEPSDIFKEIATLIPIYGGVSLERLESEARPTNRPSSDMPMPTQLLYADKIYSGLLWPCPNSDHPGSPVLYSDGFPNGKAKLTPIEIITAATITSTDFPFLLVPGRVLLQTNHDMEIQRNPVGLNTIKRDDWFELHPQDAKDLGLEEGEFAELVTTYGILQGMIRLNLDIQRGIISSTDIFGQLALQLAQSTDPNPMLKVPRLAIHPARLVKKT